MDVLLPRLFPLYPKKRKVKLAERYNLDSYMFIDYGDYLENVNKLIIKNSELKKPLEFFLRGMEEIKWINKPGFSFDEIVNLLQTGHLVSYVGVSGSVRHYKLIFSYDLEKRVLYVYDPLGFTFELEEKDIHSEMRNGISGWGFVVGSSDKQTLNIIEKEIEGIQALINKFLFTRDI